METSTLLPCAPWALRITNRRGRTPFLRHGARVSAFLTPSAGTSRGRARARQGVAVRAGDERPPDYWWLQPGDKKPDQPDQPPPPSPRREPGDVEVSQQGQARATTISIWDTKPFWCQPWSILFTGAGGIGMSWDFLHWPWLTATLAGVIVVWWFLFLVVNPQMFQSYVAEAEQEGRDWMAELDVKPEVQARLLEKMRN